MLCLCVATISAFAQSPNAEVLKAPAPAWVDYVERPEPDTKDASGPNDGWEHLLADIQFDIASESFFRRSVYEIVTKQGLEQRGSLQISFDPGYQTLTLHRLQLLRDGETIDLLPQQDIQILRREDMLEYQLYDGRLTAFLHLAGVRVGDIVDYAYTLQGASPVFQGHFVADEGLQGGMPIKRVHAVVREPAGDRIPVQLLNAELTPELRVEDGITTRTWDFRNVAGNPSEGDLPYDYHPTASISLSEFDGYAEVVQWARELWEIEAIPDALELVLRRIEAIEEPSEQIMAALRHVQNNYRYAGAMVGPHSYKPYPLDTICERQFGDCKDKTKLLLALLRGLGYEAWPVLVNFNYRGEIARWLPSPLNFDHVITAVEHQGQVYHLDPTYDAQGGTLETVFFPNLQKGLYLRPGEKTLRDIGPSGDPAAGIYTDEFFELGDYAEDVELVLEETYVGDEADDMRVYVQDRSQDGLNEDFLRFYQNQYPDIVVAQPLEVKDNLKANRLVFTASYLLKDPWERYEDEPGIRYLYLRGSTVSSELYYPDVRNRTQPFYLPHPLHVEQKITVQFPEAVAFEPEKGTIEGPGFTFDYNTRTKGTQLLIEYGYESLRGRVEAAETSEFVRALDEVDNALSYFFWVNDAVVNGEGDAAALSFTDLDIENLNWPYVMALAIAATVGLVTAVFVLLFPFQPRDPSTYDPDGIRGLSGWLIIPMFGLLVAPFYNYATLRTALPFFQAGSFAHLLNPQMETYSPLMVGLVYLEGCYAIGLIAFWLAPLVLFFRKKRILPALYIIIGSMNLLYLVISVGGFFYIAQTSAVLTMSYVWDEMPRNIGVFVGGLIWIAYFAGSKRVRNTFVR